MDILPFTYTFEYKTANNGDKTIIGCEAKIHPSFVRNRNRRYNAIANKYEIVDTSELRGGIGDY